MAATSEIDSNAAGAGKGRVIFRHRLATRITHWTWAVALFFLLLSGLQIFNAHPTLYVGEQSGFEFDNSILSIKAELDANDVPQGVTTVFGRRFETTGVLGASGPGDSPSYRAFPAWATLPSYQDLATGRVVHFFFAWFFVAAFLVWFVSSLISGHLRRDILPSAADIRALPKSIGDHLRFRFHHDGRYNGLQKLSYAGILLVVFPLIVLTGLTMSPGMDAAWPFLTEVFGGRQTARTIHFLCMLLLVAFFLVHIFMVVAAGPLNEMRSIVTGWYRTDPDTNDGGRTAMSRIVVNRRKFLTVAGVAAATVPLSGCDALDGFLSGQSGVRGFMASANGLTYRVQRLLIGADQLAPEFSASEVRQGQRPNGSTDPEEDDYLKLKANAFADYRLSVAGLVEKPASYSLAELRNMPARTQITRHDCVEGWSCIAKWTGVPLAKILDEARVKPEARFVVFHCYDRMSLGLAGTGALLRIDRSDRCPPSADDPRLWLQRPAAAGRQRRAAQGPDRAAAGLQDGEIHQVDRSRLDARTLRRRQGRFLGRRRL